MYMKVPEATWPWPLDGVQSWFEELWNHVSWAATQAVSVVSTWIASAGSWVIDSLRWALGLLQDAVWGMVGWVVDSLRWAQGHLQDAVWGMVGWVYDSLSLALGNLWIGLTGAIGGLWTNLVDSFGNLWLNINEGLGSIWTGITGAVGGLWTSINEGLGNLWTGFVDALGNVVGGVSEMITGAVNVIGTWVGEALTGVVTALGEALSGFVGWLQQQFNTLIGWLVGGIQWLGAQLNSVFTAIGSFIFAPITAAMKPGSPPAPLGAVTADFTKTILSNIIAEAEKIHKSPADRGQAVAAGAAVLGGITLMHSVGGALTMAFDATHPAKLWGAQELFQRVVLNLMSSPVTAAILATPVAIGIVTPMKQYFNAMFTPEVPGPGDLIRFVVREVITVEIFYENMKWHGYSLFWAKAHWEVHWVLPAYAQLIDAFHRGIISATERDKYIVWHDYKPEKRPGIAVSDMKIMGGLTKTLIPRVDLRRGYRIGKLTRSNLDERYGWLGYEKDTQLMSDIQVGLAYEAERNKLRDNARADLVKGYIIEATMRADLTVLDYSTEAIDYFVADALGDRERKQKDALIDIFVDGYLKDLITEAELRSNLSLIFADPEAMDLEIERAFTRKYRKPKPPAPSTPDKAVKELQKLRVALAAAEYRKYVIEKAELRGDLIAAGLDPAVAAARADYEEVKRPIRKPSDSEIARLQEQRRTRKTQETIVVEEYRKGLISSGAAVDKLVALGLSEILATAIVQLEYLRALPKPGAE